MLKLDNVFIFLIYTDPSQLTETPHTEKDSKFPGGGRVEHKTELKKRSRQEVKEPGAHFSAWVDQNLQPMKPPVFLNLI